MTATQRGQLLAGLGVAAFALTGLLAFVAPEGFRAVAFLVAIVAMVGVMVLVLLPDD